MNSPRKYRDEDWMLERVREGRSSAEIAGLCEVTEKTVERWIERHDVHPYRDERWLESQIGQHVSERAIAEWCGVTEQTVKRWMRRYDIEHPGLAPASVMRSFLEDRFADLEQVSNEALISVLWQRYQVRVQYAEIARAVGTTPQYVRQVLGAGSGGDIGQLIDSMAFLGSESVPDDLATAVRARDGGACVRCGSGEDIEMHHVIPGESTLDNLATLCRDCHHDAHGGDFYTSTLVYDSHEKFWQDWRRG